MASVGGTNACSPPRISPETTHCPFNFTQTENPEGLFNSNTRQCLGMNVENRSKWLTVFVFAIAMAWVESAVVFYLRTMIDRLQPLQADPLPIVGSFGPVELAREVATMVMHFTVGVLAGRTWRARIGYMAISFGVWDIFYYVFLKVMCGWPKSLFDWDILFLLPLPWWGPVLAPLLIALLMILWGTLASRTHSTRAPLPFNSGLLILSAIGAGLALYVFMADAIRVANLGVDEVRNVLPSRFNWPVFCLAFGLMTAPAARMLQTMFIRQRRSLTNERLATM